MPFEVEQVDLTKLARDLYRQFDKAPPLGYLLGRGVLRDAVVEQLGCSELEAENLVETLISLEYLTFKGSPTEEVDCLQPWAISTKED